MRHIVAAWRGFGELSGYCVAYEDKSALAGETYFQCESEKSEAIVFAFFEHAARLARNTGGIVVRSGRSLACLTCYAAQSGSQRRSALHLFRHRRGEPVNIVKVCIVSLCSVVVGVSLLDTVRSVLSEGYVEPVIVNAAFWSLLVIWGIFLPLASVFKFTRTRARRSD